MKNCKKCNAEFEVTDGDRAFYDGISPTFDGKKYPIPEPTHCPDCRQQRRIAICNERHLYPGKCDLCQKPTLTEHTPENRPTIYCRECWHGDKWDIRDYGQDVDFSRPFLEQVMELKKNSPCQALDLEGLNENSEYAHHAGDLKNCYLIMHADSCEDCSYGYGFKFNTSCMDGFYNLHSELCFDSIDVHRSYGLIGCQECNNCNSSAFLRDCIGCKNCFGCYGLRQKEFCFENQQFSREEYEAKMAEIDLGSYEQYQAYKKRFAELQLKHHFKENQGYNLQNCFGNHLTNCKDLSYCFDCEDVETGKYCYQIVIGGKNLYDMYQYGTNIQNSYECCICGQDSYHVYFSSSCHMSCNELFYCWYVESSSNLFGCVNMLRSKYCILNKQYTPEEYDKMVARIIEHMQKTGEWGEFFPIGGGLHGYNKTTAQMYYPLTREEALAQGYGWDDYEPSLPDVNKTAAADLPDNIRDVSDDILDTAIECEVSKRLFKVTPLELSLLRRNGVPLPRRCPDQRHMDRFHLRNPRRFWARDCDKCGKKIRTTYSPERPETVYCEQCYLDEVY
jgi:hypothetical protein